MTTQITAQVDIDFITLVMAHMYPDSGIQHGHRDMGYALISIGLRSLSYIGCICVGLLANSRTKHDTLELEEALAGYDQ